MKEDSNPQAAPEHDEKTGSFAPRTAGEAYYEQEKAKRKSPPWWIAGVLAIALSTGGYFGWMKYQDDKLASASFVTPDLILSVAALVQAEEEHGHAAAAEPEVELRDRAERAIARLKNAQAHLIAKAAVPNNVRLEDSQVALLQYAAVNPGKQLRSSQYGPYRGILTPCFISGHDVHWIDETGTIVEHIPVETQLSVEDEKARAVLNQAVQYEQTIVAVVYEKGIEYYDESGQQFEPIKN